RSRRHDARAPWRAERKNHSRRCGRLLARRGPPALPGSTVPAADSCALSSPAVGIKCSFGMLGGKRLFPKLSDPPRVKSDLVWQEKRRRSAVLEFRRGRASDIDSYTACPTQFLRHALSVVHKSPRSQPRSQPRHNSSRSMAGGVVFFQDQATLRARRRHRPNVTNPALGPKHLRRKPLVVEPSKVGHKIWPNLRRNHH